MHNRSIEAIVARNVRAKRLHAEMSLDQLGNRAGVSKGALVALENASGNPNLGTVSRIADALGLPASRLLEDSSGAEVHIVQATASQPVWRGPEGGEARWLLTTKTLAPVELWWWHLHEGETGNCRRHGAGVVETVTVTSGQLVLVVSDDQHSLPTGGCAEFGASLAHSYRTAGAEVCEFLVTVPLPSRNGSQTPG